MICLLKNILLLYCFLCFENSLSAQNIIFKNDLGNQPLMFLDTSFFITGQNIKVVIGPRIKDTKNTIFFNKHFLISNTVIDSFWIKGSYLQYLSVENSKFTKPIEIDSTDFDTLEIKGSIISNPLIIRNCIIQNLFLLDNNYSGRINFINCSIQNFDASHSKFPISISFLNCNFQNLVCTNSKFEQDLIIQSSSLLNSLNLDSSIFEKKISVTQITTSQNTVFSFNNISLPDTFDFSNNPSISSQINLTKVKAVSEKKCILFLQGTDISKLNLQYVYFILMFPDSTSNDEKHVIYENLLQNLKQNSLEESFKLLDIDYHRFKIKSSFLGSLWWWIPEYWSNYGYNPEYIFSRTFLFLVFFIIINFFALNQLCKVYSPLKIPTYYRKYSLNRLWFTCIYTFSIFFTLSLKFDKIKFSFKVATIYILLMHIIGIICLAYLANFVIQK